jgi:hypothetical protein
MNLSQACRQLLVIHQHVRDCQVQALMSNDLDQIKALRRQEGIARQERRRLCKLISGECRLRVDCWEHGRPYSQVESRLARRGTRGK